MNDDDVKKQALALETAWKKATRSPLRVTLSNDTREYLESLKARWEENDGKRYSLSSIVELIILDYSQLEDNGPA